MDDNRKQTPGTCTPSVAARIELTALITVPGQKVYISQYFSNDLNVNRGDGTTTNKWSLDTHTYSGAGIYTITLMLSGATRWTFGSYTSALVYKPQTTASDIYVSYFPDLSTYVGPSATDAGNGFFQYFNSQGALSSFPA